jgi:argininosuccinate lyase
VIRPVVDEDIYTVNERRLSELISSVITGKLHTGRLRNEQIATDMRIWLRDQLRALEDIMKATLHVCVSRAEAEIGILMPGYTHFQRAQPIRFSHWLLSHATYMVEDLKRLRGVMERVNSCPLGVGALAGNPFVIDQVMLAKELYFDSVYLNSLATVADRDFVTETL